MNQATRFLVMAAACLALSAKANTVTYNTLVGASTSGPVDATATFTTSTNDLQVTLTNLTTNPKDVAQLLSGLSFKLSGGQTAGSLTSSSGNEITISGGGAYSVGPVVSTEWGLTNNVSGGLKLDVLGYGGPDDLIVIAPSGLHPYSNANASIAGNGPHNPFLDGTATFNLAITGLTAGSNVSSANFWFGTTEGQYSATGTCRVPDESVTAILLCLGLGATALAVRRRRSSQ